MVSVGARPVLFYTIRTIKTFHLQVITHINRQNEENITDVQTYSPWTQKHSHPSHLCSGVWGGGGDCHTEPVSEQQGPMHKERAKSQRPSSASQGLSGDGGGDKRRLLCEWRRPCCLPSSAPPFNTAFTASALLVMLAAILQPTRGGPAVPAQGSASSVQREVAGSPPCSPGGRVDGQEVFVSRGTPQPRLPEVLRAREEKLSPSGPHAAPQERVDASAAGRLGRERLKHLTVLPVDPSRPHLHQGRLTPGVVGDSRDGASGHWKHTTTNRQNRFMQPTGV